MTGRVIRFPVERARPPVETVDAVRLLEVGPSPFLASLLLWADESGRIVPELLRVDEAVEIVRKGWSG